MPPQIEKANAFRALHERSGTFDFARDAASGAKLNSLFAPFA